MSTRPQTWMCRHCRVEIVKERVGTDVIVRWFAKRPQEGVALTIECGGLPLLGYGPGAFGYHEPL